MLLLGNTLILLLGSIFVFSEGALVDTLIKCSIRDENCLKGFYESLVATMVKDGAPELGLDKIDPVHLKEVSVQLLGILNVTLSEGTFEGIKSCELKTYRNNFDDRISSLHYLCDKIIISGRYKMDLFGSLLHTSGLNIKNINGNGDGKIIADKVEILLVYSYYFEKNDGGVYFKFDVNNVNHTFDVLEKATFEADNLIDGDPESSKQAIAYLNDNWKLILKTFGKDFFNKVIEYINLYVKKIFDNVPSHLFITEDLTPYVQ